MRQASDSPAAWQSLCSGGRTARSALLSCQVARPNGSAVQQSAATTPTYIRPSSTRSDRLTCLNDRHATSYRSEDLDRGLSRSRTRCRIELYEVQRGACGAAGPANAPGSVLGGPPSASRARSARAQIKFAHPSRQGSTAHSCLPASRLSSWRQRLPCHSPGPHLDRDLPRGASPGIGTIT